MHIMAHISIRLKYGMTRLVHGTASDSPTQELTRALNAAQACTSCGATARLTCAELGTRPPAAANAIGKQIREKSLTTTPAWTHCRVFIKFCVQRRLILEGLILEPPRGAASRARANQRPRRPHHAAKLASAARDQQSPSSSQH